MNILITSAGQRVSLIKAFQQELRKIFPDAKVFAVDMQPELSAACNVAHKYFKVKPVTHQDYIPELLALCEKEEIKMVVPTIDTELLVLGSHKALFERHNVHLIVSGLPFIEQCRDKRKINQFFERNGIEIPQLFEKSNLRFPLFIKPYDGSLSVDTFLVKKEENLTEYHLSNEKFMFMEYMDKAENDEYTVDMYYGRDHHVKCIIPRKRILIRAGEVNKGLTEKNLIVPYLKERLGFIDGAIGCLTLQLFLNRNTLRIVGIEINPRFGGGYPLSYRAGGNFPKWLIEEYFLQKEITYREEWESNLLMLRYDDEVLVHGYQTTVA